VQLYVALMLCALAAPALQGMWCIPAPGPRLRWPGQLEFLGVATADTVDAGAGTVRIVDERNRLVRAPKHVFGQRVRVHRVGANGSAALRAMLSGDSVDVVLVPWGGNSWCGQTLWSESARWIAPGTRAMFWATPRDRKHWVNGRPTFDVSPWEQLYKLERTAATGAVLTPDELLTFSNALPGPGWGFRPDTAFPELEPLRQWMREHPDLARRQPAHSQITYAMLESELRRVRGTVSPVAGTYRFRVVWTGADSLTVFARTERRADPALFAGRDRDTMPHADSRVVRSEGYALSSTLARRAAALPSTSPQGVEPSLDDGYFTVMEMPELTSADSTVWRGSVHVLSERLAGRTRLARQVRVTNAQIERPGRGHGVGAFGRFVRYADGRVRFESDRMIDGISFPSIRGERISTATLQPR
jgi:hypothetical protein